jgi:hypothetical protein
MARIKYGSIIADISGSIGSATFQKSLYGNTLRNRPRNTRAGTAAQFAARSQLMQCQYAWRTMSEALRRQWNQFIAFSGQSINRDRGILTTGHSLFLKYNYARLQAGFSIVTTIVYKSAPAWPTIDYIAESGNGIEIAFTDDLDALNIYPTVFLSPTRPESKSFTNEGLRFMFIDAVDEMLISILTAYQNKFGLNLTGGDFISCRFQFFHLSSPLLSAISTGVYEATVV